MFRITALLLLVATTAFGAFTLVPTELPGQFRFQFPRFNTPQTNRTLLKEGTVVTREWSFGTNETFMLVTTDYPPALVKQRPAAEFLSAARDAVLAKVRQKAAQETAIKLGGAEGIAFSGGGGPWTFKARVYFSEGRVFSLWTQGKMTPETDRFIDSLELLGPQKSDGEDAPAPSAAPAAAGPVAGGKDRLELRDPAGDDHGPGTFTYPTDAVFTKGSFDLLALRARVEGADVVFDLEVGATLVDAWKLGAGFSLQHAVVYLDLDGKADNGRLEGLPGQNVAFAKGHGWDKAVVITGDGPSRVRKELDAKAGFLAADFLVPTATRGAGRHIEARVPRSQLSPSALSTWRVQVALSGHDGFPAGRSVLVRAVNEYEGAFRFGGGTDSTCEPHVLDVFAGMAVGAKPEVEGQRKQLAYECNDDGSAKSPATLELIKLP